METEKKKTYSQLLLEAYGNDDLKVIWSTSGFAISINPQKKNEITEFKDKDFIKYIFDIFKNVSNIVEDIGVSEQIDEEDLETAKAIVKEESDLKNHLYIKKHASVECFKVFEYEIVSHMNNDDPTEIAASSAIIKIDADLQDKEEKLIFEISRRDVKELITKLTELDQKLDLLK